MNARQRILLTIAAAAAATEATAACSGTAYYNDPYYYAYEDDPAYDAAMVSGYNYVPGGLYSTAPVDPVPPTVRILLARWNATVDPACTSAVTSGDGDNDGIDANATITFACNSVTPQRTSEVTGSVTIRDLDDAVNDAGFALTFNRLSVRVVTSSGVTTSRLVSGTSSIQKGVGASGPYALLVRDLVVEATNPDPAGVAVRTTLQLQSLGTFTPEIVQGLPITQGTLTLSGQGTSTGPDGVAATVTRRTDPSLHWNNDCRTDPRSNGFDSGAIVYESRGVQTRIVYRTCTDVAVANTTVLE